MVEKYELIEVYRFLAAYKKQLGNQMGELETKMEKLEKQIGLSHPISMVQRRRGQNLTELAEML